MWLNYKNAYEYWNEQRLALNKEVQTATQQVMDKIPLANIGQQSTPALGTLYLQLTVDDLGICLPMGAMTTQVGAVLTFPIKYLFVGYNSKMTMCHSEVYTL